MIKFFSNNGASEFNFSCVRTDEQNLELLIHRVSRKPRCLVAHVERICYCFEHQFNEQLFGALVDLFIILNRCGQALRRRMIMGSISSLTENQYKTLVKHLKSDSPEIDKLPISRYSIFSNGMESTTRMVDIVEDSRELAEDPLMLARASIEYSQLENATRILEQAILDQPERMELHNELILLYRATRNENEFNRFYQLLSQKIKNVPSEWNQLIDLFKGWH